MPTQHVYGGGASATLIHPLALLAMIAGIGLILYLPRPKLIGCLIPLAILVPLSQQLYVAGVHVFVLRALVLTGIGRMLWTGLASKNRVLPYGFTIVDKLFLFWALSRAAAVVLLYKEMGAVTNQAGFLWDSLGGYFLMRFALRDKDDVARCIRALAGVACLLALTMANEKLRNQNVFGFLGGTPIIPTVRDGAIRAQGPFAHPILAGSFGATLFCLFAWLWQSGKGKMLAAAGIVASGVMVICSASSTPLFAYVAGIGAVLFWPFRKRMRLIRWGIACGLIALHLVMKAPVWFLIAHIDVVAGNSGYHRAMLIDTFVRHFKDWWLIGTNQTGTWGWDMWDLSNQFVAEGETGGLLTLTLFIAIIAKSFGRIGDSRKRVRRNRNEEWLLWLLGGALFTNCVAYFGISYFDQTAIAWYALLSMITVATAPILVRQKKSQPIAAETVEHIGAHAPVAGMVAREPQWAGAGDQF